MFKYGIYTRKSDDDRSVTEKSITEQLAECYRIVERDTLTVTKEWQESRSARHPHRREGYTQLIREIERGRINGIICWHINRLVRNLEEGGKLGQLLIEGKIKEIRTPTSTYRTGDNIMPLVIEAASATQFSLDLSKAVERGMDGSFRKGGCTHAAPQGYRNTRDPLNLKKGTVEIDPDRFETVQRAWYLFLTGTSSVRRMLDTMNESWGFRTRPTKTRGGRKLSYSAAYHMLRNPFYAGFVRRKGELVRGNHLAMITPAEFEKAQVLLSSASFSAPRVREFAYTGLMKCAHCNGQITAEIKTLSNGNLWENYRCSDSKLKCTKQGISRGKVEATIAAELDSLYVESELAMIAERNIHRTFNDELGGILQILKTNEAELQMTVARLEKLDDMWMSGVMTDESRFKRLEERELTKKAKLVMEISRIRGLAMQMEENLQRGLKFLIKAREEFRMPDDKRKKELAAALAISYVFDGIQKSIKIVVHPLLKELADYARKLGRIEPEIIGSGKQKEAAFTKQLLFGGTNESPIEPSASLMRIMQEGSFPDLWSKHNLKSSHPTHSEQDLRQSSHAEPDYENQP